MATPSWFPPLCCSMMRLTVLVMTRFLFDSVWILRPRGASLIRCPQWQPLETSGAQRRTAPSLGSSTTRFRDAPATCTPERPRSRFRSENSL